jgi:L-aminopeptidase/D-esterase-like protein
MNTNITITNVPGIKVGHVTDLEALTGCTVILCENGAVGGVDQRGGAPGTRETDLLRPLHMVNSVHGILLAGGSAFGLDAASGVMRYLDEKGIGFNTGIAKVPIVPAAILYDLGVGSSTIRPNAEMGYKACQIANSDPPSEGNVGAGTGCTVGKILGPNQAMKSGIGSAAFRLNGGIIIGAITAVNAFGDIISPENNEIIAGARSKNNKLFPLGAPGYFANTLQLMQSSIGKTALRFASRSNTVIGVVATNAKLSKNGANKVAQMAQNGLARTIRPAHTMLDGDTIFTIATGEKKADVSLVGAYAAEVVAQAIIRSVKTSTSILGIPSINDTSGT